MFVLIVMMGLFSAASAEVSRIASAVVEELMGARVKVTVDPADSWSARY